MIAVDHACRIKHDNGTLSGRSVLITGASMGARDKAESCVRAINLLVFPAGVASRF
jgi:hypothetical protein